MQLEPSRESFAQQGPPDTLLPGGPLLVCALVGRWLGWASRSGLPGALMVVFAAIALAAVSVDPDLGLYLVAAGWAGHALWDFAHLLADKVVARSASSSWRCCRREPRERPSLHIREGPRTPFF
jgi:hypothetical protein